MHRVVALAIDPVVAFDLTCAAEVFGRASDLGAPYDFRVCAAQPASVRTTSGFSITAVEGLEAPTSADTVVVPGFDRREARIAAEVIQALAAAAQRARVVSICTGAFALAEAGLLHGQRATTHWLDVEDLAEFADVTVDPRVLYVDGGKILTSAGVAAGIDLCLHIVRLDHGSDVAAAVARRLVIAPHREGGQAQYIERPLSHPGQEPVAKTCEWLLERLDEPITVEAMARHAHMSVRHFARVFTASTGASPARWLLMQRLAHARLLLETTDLPIELVAARAGMSTATTLRHHFRRELATSPTRYRKRFAGQPLHS